MSYAHLAGNSINFKVLAFCQHKKTRFASKIEKQKVGVLGGDNEQQVVGGEGFRSREVGTGVKSTHSFARSNNLIQRLFAKSCSLAQYGRTPCKTS